LLPLLLACLLTSLATYGVRILVAADGSPKAA
jgi:hypothetical protein